MDIFSLTKKQRLEIGQSRNYFTVRRRKILRCRIRIWNFISKLL